MAVKMCIVQPPVDQGEMVQLIVRVVGRGLAICFGRARGDWNGMVDQVHRMESLYPLDLVEIRRGKGVLVVEVSPSPVNERGISESGEDICALLPRELSKGERYDGCYFDDVRLVGKTLSQGKESGDVSGGDICARLMEAEKEKM